MLLGKYFILLQPGPFWNPQTDGTVAVPFATVNQWPKVSTAKWKVALTLKCIFHSMRKSCEYIYFLCLNFRALFSKWFETYPKTTGPLDFPVEKITLFCLKICRCFKLFYCAKFKHNMEDINSTAMSRGLEQEFEKWIELTKKSTNNRICDKK